MGKLPGPRSHGRGHAAVDVVTQVAGLVFVFFQQPAVDVADGDDADDDLVFHDGQVAHAAVHEQGHGLLDGGGEGGGHEPGAHDIVHGRGGGVASLGDDAVEHVALGEDAEELFVGIGDDDRADVEVVHDLHGVGDGVGGVHGGDGVAFLGEDVGERGVHGADGVGAVLRR